MSDVAALLRTSQTIAVVGLSSNPFRPSHGVSEYMQGQGYRIIPVNPYESEVLGEKAWPSLEAVPPQYHPIDIVNIFRRSEYVPAIVESAIRIGAKAIWMQEGVADEAAAARARAAGIAVVQDRCILLAHRTLGR